MKRVMKMLIFGNGNVAAFDENDEQIPDLQDRTVVELWGEYAAAHGYSVDDCEFAIGNIRGRLHGLGPGDVSAEVDT